jgi:hypothetical protein
LLLADYSVLGIAVCVRTIQLIFFYNIRVDGMNQVIAMENFVEGHGFSLSTVLPTDIATNHYSLLFAWPPGYSFLLSPFTCCSTTTTLSPVSRLSYCPLFSDNSLQKDIVRSFDGKIFNKCIHFFFSILSLWILRD